MQTFRAAYQLGKGRMRHAVQIFYTLFGFLVRLDLKNKKSRSRFGI